MEEDIFKADVPLFGTYRGVVVKFNAADDDPLKLGRVRVKVFDVMNEIPAADYQSIPWAVPAYPIGSGGSGIEAGNQYGNFSVPNEGSHVFVFFEGGDHLQPVYMAEAPDGLRGVPAFAATNYPNRRGFKTKSGVEFFIDDSNKEVKLTHPSGTEITIDENGKVKVVSGDIELGSGTMEKIVKEAFKAVYNMHTHKYIPGPSGLAETAAPTTPMADSELTEHTKAS